MLGPILLIEDNQDHEILTLRALKKHNILNEVVVAHDGAEALEFSTTRAKRVAMTADPGTHLAGPQVAQGRRPGSLRRLRSEESTRLLPVVVLTSSDEEQDLVRSYEFGANSYIRKPVDFDEFIEATRQLGLYWLVLNEAPPKSLLQRGN